MTPGRRRLVALAATLAPGAAARLLGRHAGIRAGDVQGDLSASRKERLRLLARSLGGCSDGAHAWRGTANGPPVRGADPGESGTGEESDLPPPAWPVLSGDDVIPFDLRPVSPALLELGGSLLATGERAARAAAAGLASVLGGEVTLRGRLLPGAPDPGGCALVPLELTALAGQATLAVDCGFAARLAEGVAGARGAVPVARAISPAARAVVELAVLGALDGIASETGIETALGARLGLRRGAPVRPLCVELTVTAAGTQGRALLFLPAEAVRALAASAEIPHPIADVPVPASLRSGSASLARGEAAALRPGDVLILDAPPGDRVELRLAGGARAEGRLDGDSLEVTEVDVDRRETSPQDLPVVVEVELASLPVPLREVARIAPGAVLVLGLDRRGIVTLRIGERAVATGELVDVDGAVGVRVLSLEPPR